MPKVLFIDDELEILEQYKRIVPRAKNKDNEELKNLASGLFGLDDPSGDEMGPIQDMEVLCSSQGNDGVQTVEREMKSGQPVQVAFIDMRMPPGIDGKETAKRIRAIDKNVEIVFVTAYSDTRPEQLLNEMGTPDKILYLKKPFDVSEIRQLVRNLTSKYRMERIKDDFIGNVTHELKTPLACIIGFTDLLARENEMPERCKEYVQVLRSNSELMKNLVSDLIGTLDLNSPRPAPILERACVNEILKDVYQSFAIIHHSPKVEFVLEMPERLVTARLDPVRFKQALYNLLGNALKFTEAGVVRIELAELDGKSEVTISDTGVGIPPDHMDLIFDKFHRVENKHHARPGLGLGLYLVKEILELHQFKYSVTSEVNKGTRFTISLNQERAA